MLDVETIKARIDELRSAVRAGPVTLTEAAATLGIPEPDIMAHLSLHELNRLPGSVCVIAGADGAAVIKREGETIRIDVPPLLAAILISGLLHNPTASIQVCSPLQSANISKGVH